jgi:hypothetical protein
VSVQTVISETDSEAHRQPVENHGHGEGLPTEHEESGYGSGMQQH